jgi:Uncharacterised nucleotidyltransferase
VDLHGGVESLGACSAEMYRRASWMRLGDTKVRVLGPEDHLRFLCRHLLAHGAWRPLWLCDVAAALESRPADFDWRYFLKTCHRRSDGIVWTLALAQRMLETRLEETPWARQTLRLPRWFVAAVLRSWGTAHRYRQPLAHHLRQRTGVLESLCQSWPDPITATAELRAPFNQLPRLPFQLAFCVKRSAQIALELLTAMRMSRSRTDHDR